MASPQMTETGVAYYDRLESLIASSDGDHAEKARLILLAYREANDALLAIFDSYGYDKDVHRPFLRSVLRYEMLNSAFLSYAKNKDFADLDAGVRPVIHEARPKVATELTDYLTLLETTPREYMLAAVGME